MLRPDKRQHGREDFFQFFHIQVSPLHTSLVYAVGCATQQIGLWVKKGQQQLLSNKHQSHIHTKYKCAFNSIETKARAIIELILGKYCVACRVCNIVNVEMVTLRLVPN